MLTEGTLDRLLDAIDQMGVDVAFWQHRWENRQYPIGSSVDTRALVAAADELICEEEELTPWAITLYGLALDNAVSAAVQVEVAHLLLHRARVEPATKSEFDFPDFSRRVRCERSGGRLWFEILQARAAVIDNSLIPGPPVPRHCRVELMRLALEAYGRSYAHYLREEFEPQTLPPYGGIVDRTDMWRQFLVLDGLRIVFQSMDRWDEMELVCDAYDVWYENWCNLWNNILDESPTGLGADFESRDADFERRFAETRGMIQGRPLKDPANRNATGKVLSDEFGATWVELPKPAREYLINSRILSSRLHDKDDWAPAVNEDSKAVEALLRARLGRWLDRPSTHPRAMMIRSAVDDVRRRSTKQYSRVSLSTWKDALQRGAKRGFERESARPPKL